MQKIIEKSLLLQRRIVILRALTRQYQLFLEVYLGKFCMMHVRVQRCMIQAALYVAAGVTRVKKERNLDGAACVSRPKINPS